MLAPLSRLLYNETIFRDQKPTPSYEHWIFDKAVENGVGAEYEDSVGAK